MLCIVPAADSNSGMPTAENWSIPQVFEFIAFTEGSVQLLVVVIAENLLEEPQHLNVLHRARLSCRLVSLKDPIPFPRSNEVAPQLIQSALAHRLRDSERGYQFRPRLDRFTLSNEWKAVSLWDPACLDLADPLLPVCRDGAEKLRHSPYTGLRMGPFAGRQSHAIAIAMNLAPSSYQLLIAGHEYISLKGVQSVLSHIENIDLPAYAEEGHADAQEFVDQFDDLAPRVADPKCYEIFLARNRSGPVYEYASGAPSVLRAFEADEVVISSFDQIVARTSEFSVRLHLAPEPTPAEDTAVLICA